ncbi:hypothetical protein [Actinobacillus minor]|uniref:hypothetical protein n=1 Tax=Actinobacillus minor TaxID=51047 RepID=UPI000587CD1B|nr:hypothetical protein [Actinobacillus minor]
MKEQKKCVPEIRFAGFTDDWEQRKLGEVVEFFSGLTYSPQDITNETGVLLEHQLLQLKELF